MPASTSIRFLLAVTALSTAACLAQTTSAPCPADQPAAKPCTSAPSPQQPPAAPAPTQQFPFPGETNTPAVPAPNAPNPSAATAHPFPTEAAPDMPGEAPDNPSSSSNSSSSSSSSSGSNSGDTADTPDDPTPVRRKLPKVKNLQTPDERVDEDINVAKFYLNRGNYMAAYLRSKDAVKTEPNYAETHFSLAQAAEKMKKTDEAKAEYNAYLKLSPGGDNAKAAQKALESLH